MFSIRANAPRFLALVAFGLFGDPAAAQEAIDQKLVDAGFVMRSVDTPKKLERARLLPQRTIVSRTKNGVRHYLYADTDYCKCVLIGNQSALQAYRDMSLPPVPMTDDTPPRGIPRMDLVVPGMDGLLGDTEPDDIFDLG
jgi:hypothetical protein